MPTPGAQERYFELVDKVDALFERARQRYADAMQCSAGCTDCCAGQLSVTLVEASVIAESLARMPARARSELAADARARDATKCAALDGEGRCRIYESRPLVCRSHGLPIRTPVEGETNRSPAPLVTCPRNFRTRPELSRVEASCVLDQGTLSTVLGAIDMVFADELSWPRGERIAVADLLAEPERYFEMPSDFEV